MSFLEAQVSAGHPEALAAWLSSPQRSGPMLVAIAPPASATGAVPLGVAVARLSSHHQAEVLPRVMFLPTEPGATVLAFGRDQATIAGLISSIDSARRYCAARNDAVVSGQGMTGQDMTGPVLYAATHVEELTVPSLLASATTVIALSDASSQELVDLLGVDPTAGHIAEPCEPACAWWRQSGTVYAVELALW